MIHITKCPFCGETIFRVAPTCRFCDSDLPDRSLSRAAGAGILTPVMTIGNRTIAALRTNLTPSFFERNAESLEWISAPAAGLAAIIGLVASIVVAIKLDNLMVALAGLGWVTVVGLSFYIAKRLLPACEMAVHNSPTAISSQEIFDVFALISTVILIVALLAAVYVAITFSIVTPLFTALGVAILSIYYIAMALHLDLVSTSVDPTVTAGGDALAIVQFGYKGLVRLSPIITGGALITGVVSGINLLVDTFRMNATDFGYDLSLAFSSFASATSFFTTVLLGLLFPLVAYLFFTFVYLVTDLLMAVLRLHRVSTL